MSHKLPTIASFVSAQLLASGIALAEPVDRSGIERILTSWLEQKSASYGFHELGDISLFDGAPAGISLYVARLKPRGYALLGGDTQLPPLLGYSLDHDIDLSPTPDNALRALLIRELDAMRGLAGGATARMAASAAFDANAYATRNEARWRRLQQAPAPMARLAVEEEPVSIGPLLATSWSQHRHYNYLAPAEPGCSTTEGYDYYDCKVPTGCAQTAWAQLMKFYEWPPHGHGSVSYEDGSGSVTGEHFADFSDAFDWRDMLHFYDAWLDYPQANVDAVSELMYELAVNNRADFEVAGTAASAELAGLRENFYYQGGDWVGENIPSSLRLEIVAGRPAVASIPGHAVVVDGYSNDNGDDLFHVNYGWGWFNSGWFLLDGIPGGGLQSFYSGAKPSYVPIPVKANYLPDSTDIYLAWQSPRKVAPPIGRFRVLVPSYNYNLVWSDEGRDFSKSVATGESWCGEQTWSTQEIDGETVLYSGAIPCNRLDIKNAFIPDAGSVLAIDYRLLLTNKGMMRVGVSEDGQGWETVFEKAGGYGYEPPSWQQANIDLSAYAGKPINVRISHIPASGSGWSYYGGGGIWIDRIRISSTTEMKWVAVSSKIVRSTRNYTVANAGTNVPAVRVEALVEGRWAGAAQLAVKGTGVPAAAPAAPTALSALAKAGRKVELQWLDNSKDEASFILQRKTGNGAWTGLPRLAANHDGYLDGGLVAGTQYRYRVKASNGKGASAYSNVVTVVAKP
jgi:hypothetical protein